MTLQSGTLPSAAIRPGVDARRIDDPFPTFDLPTELARLRGEWGWDGEGHAGRTLAKYPDLRVVLEAMKEGTRVPLHEAAERMTVQVIIGRLRIRLRDGDWSDFAEGSFVAIAPAVVHELEALEECGFLLTLAWPPAPPAIAGD
jgi:quercetin dioxygenase-like cupin family protein